MIQGNYRQHWVRKEFTDIPGSVLEKKLTGGLGLFFWV